MPPSLPRLRLAGLGCGGRTTTYLKIAALNPARFEIVAAVDPNPARRARVAELTGTPGLRQFHDDKAFFAEGKIADVVVIGTQDSYHVEPCLAALHLGYDVLLEKPISPDPRAVIALAAEARRLGRRVLVCHVLRYSLFYRKVKEILDSGRLGRVVSIRMSEGVGAWHQAHSFVRGHWSVVEKSSPMLLAKCCHDLDLLAWFMGAPCESVASFGGSTLFRAENAPPGAPARCTDGCPAASTCAYNAEHYLDRHRLWAGFVLEGASEGPDERIREWIRTSPWGRCVYRCDNTTVDHQVLALQFAGGATATFTMTAFAEGRTIEICGTEANLVGGDFLNRLCGSELVLRPHAGPEERFQPTTPDADEYGHGGADLGLVQALDLELACPDPEQMRTSIQTSVESHLLAFAAEQSRREGRVVDMQEFRAGLVA